MKRFKIVLVLALLNIYGSVAFSQNSGSALELFSRGMELQNSKDYYGAIEAYREALIVNDRYGDAWYNLAMCTFYLGEFDLAYEYSCEAEKYARDLSKIKNLQGLSLLSLGKLDDARVVFNEVLKKYPNDLDSRFGLAQISLYEGSLSSAEKKYLDALKRDQTSRKALLSLALICAEEGNDAAAERYINTALSYHSGEAEVHYLAAYLAAKQGKLETAERRAKSAVQLKGDYDSAYELLAEILYKQERYEEVVDLCDFIIGRDRNKSKAWYLKGISEFRSGNTERAMVDFTTGLSIDPQDEVMRFALEELIQSSVSIEDKRRSKWAEYHLVKAKEFGSNFNGPAQRYEYQKALSVDPLNLSARQSFADLLEREGLYELYLEQLYFIKENETYVTSSSPQVSEDSPKVIKTSQQIKNEDTIEALESMMTNTLSKNWNVNPFYLDKTRWQIGIYYIKNSIDLYHADVEQIISIAAASIFDGVSSTQVVVKTEPVSGFAQAYRNARENGLDYFIIMNVDETDRSIIIDSEIFSARTGTKTTEFHIYRTGNDKVSNALRRFRTSILDILPIRGKVIQKVGSTVLCDLGKSDGIVSGSKFDVVKKGSIKTQDTGVGIMYRQSDILGTLEITTSNEEISEGTFIKKGYYDTMNLDDEIVLIQIGDGADLSKNGNAASDTRPQADGSGEPVTPSAKSSELDDIKEDLKSPYKESTLISMIREIF